MLSIRPLLLRRLSWPFHCSRVAIKGYLFRSLFRTRTHKRPSTYLVLSQSLSLLSKVAQFISRPYFPETSLYTRHQCRNTHIYIYICFQNVRAVRSLFRAHVKGSRWANECHEGLVSVLMLVMFQVPAVCQIIPFDCVHDYERHVRRLSHSPSLRILFLAWTLCDCTRWQHAFPPSYP